MSVPKSFPETKEKAIQEIKRRIVKYFFYSKIFKKLMKELMDQFHFLFFKEKAMREEFLKNYGIL